MHSKVEKSKRYHRSDRETKWRWAGHIVWKVDNSCCKNLLNGAQWITNTEYQKEDGKDRKVFL